MPVRSCQENGKPGYSCGNLKCYTYTPGDESGRKGAKKKAIAQCIAIDENPGSDAETAAMAEDIKDQLFGDCNC